MVKHTIPTNPNLLKERLVPVQKAGGEFPYQVGRKAVHRYVFTGIRGVQLATVLIGHRRFTSIEAIERFLRETNKQAGGGESQRMTEQEIRSAKAAVGLKTK